jgi:Flp pilus assembly pilin Flp
LSGAGWQIFSKEAPFGPDKPYMNIQVRARLRRRSQRGQTLVEYALILAFISVVAISVLIRLGEEVRSVFTTISSQLAVANSSH